MNIHRMLLAITVPLVLAGGCTGRAGNGPGTEGTAAPVLASAGGLVVDKFDDYLPGALPPPWRTLGAPGEGVSVALDVAGESPFIANGVSGVGVVVSDSSTASGADAGFAQTFRTTPPPDHPLRLSFDFMIAGLGAEPVEPTVCLGDAQGNGISLILRRDGSLGLLQPDGKFLPVRKMDLETWYHVILDVPALTANAGAMTLHVTPHGGPEKQYADLPLPRGIAQFEEVRFFQRGADEGTGKWAVDNITMAGAVDVPRKQWWPFDQPPLDALRKESRKVFPYYFPVMRAAGSNKDPGMDWWNTHATNPGNPWPPHGKAAAPFGSYAQERPLPRIPYSADKNEQLARAMEEEVRIAARLGVDGFLLDFWGYDMVWNKYSQALLDAAQRVDPGFKILVAAYPKKTVENDPKGLQDPAEFAANVKPYLTHPAAFHLPDGRVVLSCWAADRWPAPWWKAVLENLEAGGMKVAFVPLLTGPLSSSGPAFAPISCGFATWGPSDPAFTKRPGGTYDFPAAAHRYVSIAFTPVRTQDPRPYKGVYWEAHNSLLFRSTWDSAIRSGADWVLLVTWTDYGEAAGLAPSTRTGFAFYDLTAYYTAWFKTGKQPPIVRDALYYFYRRHRMDAQARYGKTFKPASNANYPTQNEVELLGFLKAPGVLEIELGGKVERKNAEAGITSMRVPLTNGLPVFRLERKGKVILEGAGRCAITDGVPFQTPIYNAGVIAEDRVQ